MLIGLRVVGSPYPADTRTRSPVFGQQDDSKFHMTFSWYGLNVQAHQGVECPIRPINNTKLPGSSQ